MSPREILRARAKSVIRSVIPREVRNWVRSPSKTATWLWHSARFKIGIKEKLRISEQDTLLCHPLAYLAVRRGQIGDSEQSAEWQQFLSLCHRGMFLFDVGANFGIFSLACAKFGGTAIAIDPSPISTGMISTQLHLNRLAESVQVLEAAVGDVEGSLEMLSSGIFSDGYFRYETGRDHRELTRVQLTTVDKLTEQFGVPTHLKIDVEGFEAAVIRGSMRLLEHHSPLVFLELHNEMVRSSGGDPSFCVKQLQGLNYRISSVYGKPLTSEEAVRPAICRILARR